MLDAILGRSVCEVQDSTVIPMSSIVVSEVARLKALLRFSPRAA
jgi:hypothetical protein